MGIAVTVEFVAEARASVTVAKLVAKLLRSRRKLFRSRCGTYCCCCEDIELTVSTMECVINYLASGSWLYQVPEAYGRRVPV